MAASRSCIMALLGLLAACCLFATASAGRVAPVEANLDLTLCLTGTLSGTEKVVVTVLNVVGKPVFELVGGLVTVKKTLHLGSTDPLELLIQGLGINEKLKLVLADLVPDILDALLQGITATVEPVVLNIVKDVGGVLKIVNGLTGKVLGICSP